MQIPVLPPLEAIDEEILYNPGIKDKLNQMIEDGQLPDAYFQHKAYLDAPADTPVYPLVVYLDGVKFQRVDGVLGVWIYNLVTGLRQLLVVVRKSQLCACGCRGWCTVFALLLMLNWSFLHMKRGQRPDARHDHAEWFMPSDHARAAMAGTLLNWIGAVIFLKVDMMEFVSTFGFP